MDGIERHPKSAVVSPITSNTARPRPARTFFSPLLSWACWLFLKATGWKIKGDWPGDPKLVVIAAPHTSNMDGIYMLAAIGYYRVKVRWMGKKELTTGPFGGLIKWLGCVPIDRTSKNDVVGQMVDTMNDTDEMLLAVPPEGTRAKTRAWKSGFYHIADRAGVPLLCSVLDYGTRTIQLAAIIRTSGDYDTDFGVIREFYKEAKGLREGDFSVERPD